MTIKRIIPNDVSDSIEKLSSALEQYPSLNKDFLDFSFDLESSTKIPHRDTSDFSESKIGPKLELPSSSNQLSPRIERIVSNNDLLPAHFLSEGQKSQTSVARIVLTKAQGNLASGTGWGTGFMISSNYFMTNNHVVPDKNFLSNIRAQFNYQLTKDGLDSATTSYKPDPTGVFHTSQELDYTIFKLKNQPIGSPPEHEILAGHEWGYIELNLEPSYHQKVRFNIIQHPRGRHKEVALQNNIITDLFENHVRYTTDTQHSSSGSPVFDNFWNLVALHHSGGAQDSAGNWLNNQGVRIDRIAEDLQHHFSNEPDFLNSIGLL